jgi:hypothetical protein
MSQKKECGPTRFRAERENKIEKDFSAFLWGRKRRLASAARALRAEWENAVAKLYTHTCAPAFFQVCVWRSENARHVHRAKALAALSILRAHDRGKQ